MPNLMILLAFLTTLHSIWSLSRGNLVALPLVLISSETLMAAYIWHTGYTTVFANVWSRGGSLANGEKNTVYFLCIYVIIFVVYVLQTRCSSYRRATTDLKGFASRQTRRLKLSIPLMLFAFSIYHISILDLDIVFRSNEYLLMSSMAAVKEMTLVNVFVQSTHKLVGLFALFLFSNCIVQGKKREIAILLIPALWFYFFALGGHSRYSVVNALALALPLLIASKWRFKIFGLFMLGLAVLNLVGSLNGRDSEVQGLSAIPTFFETAFSFSADEGFEILGNIYEGVFTQGEGFFYDDYQFPLGYKLSSLSPFPSFIDGYSTTFQDYQIRLHEYVPMGATSEVRIFGGAFLMYYFAILISAYCLLFSWLKRRKYVYFLISLIIFVLAMHLQFTYPTRNVVRFFYLIILFYFSERFFGSIIFSVRIRSQHTIRTLE
jgi:hypothetical protein